MAARTASREFLAFPAIFRAGATLIEKHEEEKKQREGLHGSLRGKRAAAVDAAAASLGSLALIPFALLVKLELDNHHAWEVLMSATTV